MIAASGSITESSAIWVALGALVVSAVTLWVTYGQKREETLMTTLSWMEGGTQKRALGIASIKYWLSLVDRPFIGRLPARSRDLLIRTLFSSAVYLLTASEQGRSVQELDNLTQIMSILVEIGDSQRAARQYLDRYQLLLEVIKAAPRADLDRHIWREGETGGAQPAPRSDRPAPQPTAARRPSDALPTPRKQHERLTIDGEQLDGWRKKLGNIVATGSASRPLEPIHS
jgi:hypothetical protein